MKVWIIYDSKFGHCKRLAEALEDLLEGDCNVSVGDAKKLSPADVFAEYPDALLVGGPLRLGKPSRSISSWIRRFYQISLKTGIHVKKTFAFCTWGCTPSCEPSWQQIFQKYPFATMVFPQVLAVQVIAKDLPIVFEKNPQIYEIIENLRGFLFQENNFGDS